MKCVSYTCPVETRFLCYSSSVAISFSSPPLCSSLSLYPVAASLQSVYPHIFRPLSPFPHSTSPIRPDSISTHSSILSHFAIHSNIHSRLSCPLLFPSSPRQQFFVIRSPFFQLFVSPGLYSFTLSHLSPVSLTSSERFSPMLHFLVSCSRSLLNYHPNPSLSPIYCRSLWFYRFSPSTHSLPPIVRTTQNHWSPPTLSPILADQIFWGTTWRRPGIGRVGGTTGSSSRSWE